MTARNHADLIAFFAIAREKSFTRAAAKLGVSPSALSHTINGLEARLGLRLLTRTTRSVSPTEAGERLIANIEPRFDEIEAELAALSQMRNTPSGTVRITASESAARSILWPKLSPLLKTYPDLRLEISCNTAFVDIAAEKFDAGVRLGESLSQDMVAVRIGPDLTMSAFATPDYFNRNGRPQTPEDLTSHDCINLRQLTYGGIYAWELEKDGREQRVRVDGKIIFNNPAMIVDAALEGHGIGFLPNEFMQDHFASGKLERVLQDWCPPFAGYHLYYPSRRHMSPAFRVVVEALKWRQN
jgi:DNA-binding transcriptional LysR family regulator